MSLDPSLASSVVLVCAAIVMVFAALNDAARYRIPNAACLGLVLLFPLYNLTREPSLDWGAHLFVFVLFFAIGYSFYLRKWAGAGDIKFIAAASLWAGPSLWPQLLFITAIAGGVLSLGIGLSTLVKAKRNPSDPAAPTVRKTPIPYGVAIAIGGLCTLALLSNPHILAAG